MTCITFDGDLWLLDMTGTVDHPDISFRAAVDVSVDVPLGVLTLVTGVAGSGKSSLIHGCLPGEDDQGREVISVDQSAIRGSRRSKPATYTGVLDPIRTAFAKVNGVKPALFSANSAGACPERKGIGLVYTDLAFMAGVASVCEACGGRRFTAEVLEHTLRGADIASARHVDHAGPRLLHREAGPTDPRAARPGRGGLPQPPSTAEHVVRR